MSGADPVLMRLAALPVEDKTRSALRQRYESLVETAASCYRMDETVARALIARQLRGLDLIHALSDQPLEPS